MVSAVYAVAGRPFQLELEQTCTDWLDQLAPAYRPFAVDHHAESEGHHTKSEDYHTDSEDYHTDSDLLFVLRAKKGQISLLHPDYRFVTLAETADLDYRVSRSSQGNYRIAFLDHEGQVQAMLEADAHFTQVDVVIAPNSVYASALLNNALMLAFSCAGAYHQLLLVHASVPQIGDKAFLFQGLSGTGKSTHSSLWCEHIPDVQLLNDDNPVVEVLKDGKIAVWGTPWSGKTPCYRNVRCQLGGVVRLQQAQENRIRRLRPAEAFASLLASCSTMVWDKAAFIAIGDTVMQVITQVPSYQLENLPNREAALLSHQHLCGHESA